MNNLAWYNHDFVAVGSQLFLPYSGCPASDTPFMLIRLQQAVSDMILVIFLFVFCIRGQLATKDVVNLAVFMPKIGLWSVGKTVAPAAQLAADYVNNNDQILGQYTINISYYDTGCNQGKAIRQLIHETETKRRMDGIIGGDCDPVCEVLALFASRKFLPVISWGCKSNRLSDKSLVNTSFSSYVQKQNDHIYI